MAKDMSKVYWGMTTDQLRKLKSQKHEQHYILENKPEGFFNDHDLRVLRQQIRWIDAVLAARNLQKPLF